ncbi:LacI family DNA-binding transcriptional regulator [Candidatus Roseilinea sp. NK_OTU-006]|jgi:alanine racemase|uniref:LacI family DNA-binding transcriptional regulator n=1 Tax=Candidatus Roseilinea sp. NK_OTU-006 TaxID=2704250 RepID=UPI00145FA38F|nr:substrate-binding domain-containing protein [Candidatus Roseilinea sp. NK_OTU-006]
MTERNPAAEALPDRAYGSGSRARRRSVHSHKVTIGDIARHAGVSKTAVSFAFNKPGRLSAETTRHILDVARELGYTPNPVARSLNTRRTHALGVIVPQDIPTVLSNPFFAELMSGIGEVCKVEGMSLVIVPPMRGSLVEATYAALVDGCIVTGLSAEDKVVRALRMRRIPFVMLDADAPDDIASVQVDDSRGAYLAMKHVLDLGHRRIAIATFEPFTGRVEDYTGTLRHRFSGYQAALTEVGMLLCSPGIHVIECSCDVAGGQRAFQLLTKLRPQPTAVIALSDVIAFGVIAAAHCAGVRVPEDLSVVGFDDIEASHLLRPALTTVRQPTREKGRQAAEMFIQMLHAEGAAKPRHVMLPVELVVRESSARATR